MLENMNSNLLKGKTAALVTRLGWDRLNGLSTRAALVEMRDSYARLTRTPAAQAMAAELNKLVAMADKLGVA